MRIEAQSKLGYYPTPDTQLPLILTWLQLPAADLVRALDPCCGKGEALAYLAHGLGRIATYGIELSYSRAEEAERLLDHVLATGFENAVLTDGTFSFCLLNPPYDGETATGGGERLEGRFLHSTTPLLCENGVLAYIIPETRLDEKIARHLAGWYADLRCFRFTEPDYQAFRQVVIFGRKKAYRQPTQEAVDEIRAWALGNLVVGYEDCLVLLTDDEILAARVEKAIGKKPEELQIANRVVALTSGQALNKQNASDETLVWAMKAQAWLYAQPVVVVEDESTRPTKKVHVPILADLPTLDAGAGVYVIPPSPVAGPKGQAFRFKHMPVTEEDYLRAADKAALALEKSRSWLNLIQEIDGVAKQPGRHITPALTPKQGHISMLVTAGLLGTTLVTHNGFPLLLKGGTEKYTVKIDEEADGVHPSEEEEIEYDPDDPEKKKSLFRVRVEERSRPTLWTLDATGNFTFSNDPVKISDTLRIHVAELAQRVLGRNIPRYDLKPQAWEWQVFDPLSQGRYLPGRKETGLTDFQKHLSVALGRLLLGTGSGLINAEMGAGKCVVEGTLVPTERGLLPIEQLRPPYAARGSTLLQIGVQSVDGLRETSHFYDSGLKPTIQITTRCGFQLAGTLIHPVLVLTPEGQRAWKMLSDIQEGDYVAIQRFGGIFGNNRKLPPPDYAPSCHPAQAHPKKVRIPTELTPDLTYLLGMIVGDGSMRDPATVGYTTADPELLAALQAQGASMGIEVHLQAGGRMGYRLHSVIFKRWLNQLGLSNEKAERKDVPWVILSAPQDCVRAFLQGLFDTDGSGLKNGSVEFCTTSETLARKVHLLLLQFGIVGVLRHKTNHHAGAWIITLYGAQARLFYDRIGFRLPRKQERRFCLPARSNSNIDVVPHLPPIQFERVPRDFRVYLRGLESPSYEKLEQMAAVYPELRGLISPRFFWDRVDEVKDTGRQRCYDLAVPATHAFVTNGIVSHNTTMALSAAEYMNEAFRRNGSNKTSYPVLVVGPGIVTGNENWPKETREVVPGATPKVIESAARPVPKPAKVVDWLESIGVKLDDEDAFEGKSAKAAWKAIVEEANKQGKLAGPDNRRARFALWHTLQHGEKHAPRKRQGAEKPNLLDTRIGGFAWLGLGELARDKTHQAEMRRRYSLAQFVDEYKRGELPQKSVAILSYETAKLGSGRVPAMSTRKLRLRWKEKGEWYTKVIEACTCPHCGKFVAGDYDEEGHAVMGNIITPETAAQFVGAKRRYCQSPTPRWVWNPETGQHEWRDTDENGNKLVCGAPLFAYTELRREAAARYVQRKAKNFFPLLLVDELHEAKAKGTGNGWALTVLANCSPYTLGLTGTLFGGYSTTIFWLMYRLSALVRRDFGFHDENEWARRYGLLRYTFYVSKPEDVMEDGSYTGQKFLSRVDERPGILPAIIRVGLPKIAFASLQDIGLPLPPYNEEVVWLQMSNGMADQYHDQADGSMLGKPYPPASLYNWAIDEMKEGTKGALSVWLTTALNRVNSMFRDEEVWFNRRIEGKGKYALRHPELVTTLDAIGDATISPKDRWLASRCQAERDEGRKSIVFIRQTGKRDIQPHVAQILQDNGLRVGVLSPSVEPRRRVAWIEKHIGSIDVLITNARLVKVGLNLRMFATAVFYEIEWSLPILWQAMRRVYRPGAPLPVRVLFPTYENTLEERALNLLGQKMKAAQLFYGDEVASALCDDEEGDFLNDLILSVLAAEKQPSDDRLERVTSIFATQNDITASPLGSLTAASPHLNPFEARTWSEWLAARNKALPTRNGRRKSAAAQGQLSLF